VFSSPSPLYPRPCEQHLLDSRPILSTFIQHFLNSYVSGTVLCKRVLIVDSTESLPSGVLLLVDFGWRKGTAWQYLSGQMVRHAVAGSAAGAEGDTLSWLLTDNLPIQVSLQQWPEGKGCVSPGPALSDPQNALHQRG
jgi:hypothetical protein